MSRDHGPLPQAPKGVKTFLHWHGAFGPLIKLDMCNSSVHRKTLPGDPPVTVLLRRSGRARRITLRVSSLDGRVTVTVPPHVSETAAMDFVSEKRGWLAAQLGRVPSEQFVGAGSVLPIAGVAHVVSTGGESERPVISIGADRPAGPQVRRFVIDAARAHFADAAARHAARLGREHGRIALRDTRSRWGSCSTEGNLMFSWRLVLAPPEVLDYVAAHEVAHLAQMDHSPAFWAVVGELFPGHAAARRWLRGQGATLHSWTFDA